jgi:hypothetical protein
VDYDGRSIIDQLLVVFDIFCVVMGLPTVFGDSSRGAVLDSSIRKDVQRVLSEDTPMDVDYVV